MIRSLFQLARKLPQVASKAERLHQELSRQWRTPAFEREVHITLATTEEGLSIARVMRGVLSSLPEYQWRIDEEAQEIHISLTASIWLLRSRLLPYWVKTIEVAIGGPCHIQLGRWEACEHQVKIVPCVFCEDAMIDAKFEILEPPAVGTLMTAPPNQGGPLRLFPNWGPWATILGLTYTQNGGDMAAALSVADAASQELSDCIKEEGTRRATLASEAE